MKFIIVLIGHFLGDFVFQNAKMANDKIENRKIMLKHWLIYGLSLLPFMIWYGEWWNVLIFFAIGFFTHAIIDWARTGLERKRFKKQPFWLFIIDQILHISILLVLSHFLPQTNGLGNWVVDLAKKHIPGGELGAILIVALGYIICLNPTGILVKKVFLKLGYQKEDVPTDESQTKAQISGYAIGMLERVCVFTLTLLGQYTAISFVIAAKSLARMKQFEEKDFAEKYLVGTLLSVVIALLLGIAVNLARGA